MYIDDILIVTKGTKTEHLNKVREVMKVLDEANLQLEAEKCVLALDSIEWLCYKNRHFPSKCKISGNNQKIEANKLKATTFILRCRQSIQ